MQRRGAGRRGEAWRGRRRWVRALLGTTNHLRKCGLADRIVVGKWYGLKGRREGEEREVEEGWLSERLVGWLGCVLRGLGSCVWLSPRLSCVVVLCVGVVRLMRCSYTLLKGWKCMMTAGEMGGWVTRCSECIDSNTFVALCLWC